jgi:hypothetical protein
MGPADDALALLRSIEGVTDAKITGGDAGKVSALVESRAETMVGPLISRAIVEKGWDLLELTPKDLSLEDVFIELVTEESVDASQADQQKVAEVSG